MKKSPADYSLDDIPELEEADFALEASARPRIPYSSDGGDIGDWFSIGTITTDALSSETDW